MVPIKKNQPNPRKKWITAANRDMVPKAVFNENWNLVFNKKMYEMYRRFLHTYKDIPYPREPATSVMSLRNEEEISQPYRKIEGAMWATLIATEESRNILARKE